VAIVIALCFRRECEGPERATGVPARTAGPGHVRLDQLTSDEWLKGELIALYDGRLEFDSKNSRI